MNNQELAEQVRQALINVENAQRECVLEGLEIQRFKYVINHLNEAIELLELKEPWV